MTDYPTPPEIGTHVVITTTSGHTYEDVVTEFDASDGAVIVSSGEIVSNHLPDMSRFKIAGKVITAATIMAAALALPATAHADPSDWTYTVTVDLPGCDHEDGNADGNPCVWTDPDTGRLFYVTSTNYREIVK